MSSRPLVFVARASIQDGLGHLVRTLSVVKEAVQRGPVKLIVVGDGSGSHLIEAAGIPWIHAANDDDAAREALDCGARVAAFDTLHFDAAAFEKVSRSLVTASLSPVFSRMQQVDHLFHRTLKNDPSWPENGPFPAIHKGLQYAVLPSWLRRLQTRTYREHLMENKLAIALSMGGTDAPNRTLKLLRLLSQCPHKLVLFVALGDAYTHSYEELLACAAENRQEIILLKSNESMWRVLKGAALLLCAGGLTTYEAAYIGLPAINILQREEWSYLFEELAERGACMTLPPVEGSLERALQCVTALAGDRDRLLGMHLASKGLIPSGGAKRVAAKLRRLRR